MYEKLVKPHDPTLKKNDRNTDLQRGQRVRLGTLQERIQHCLDVQLIPNQDGNVQLQGQHDGLVGFQHPK